MIQIRTVKFLLKSLLLDYRNFLALVIKIIIILNNNNFLGSDEEKLKFAFKIYDINGDGYISNGELFDVYYFSYYKSFRY